MPLQYCNCIGYPAHPSVSARSKRSPSFIRDLSPSHHSPSNRYLVSWCDPAKNSARYSSAYHSRTTQTHTSNCLSPGIQKTCRDGSYGGRCLHNSGCRPQSSYCCYGTDSVIR